MSEIEVEGKTVEEAIQQGLQSMGCTKDKVEIKILNEGTAGLFGLMGSKPARVRITPKEESPADYVAAQKKIKEILSVILKLMKIDFQDINTAMLTGRLFADIKSADSRFIIGKNGQTLDSLEFILNLMLNRDENTRVKVTLDIEGYRRRQEEKLQSLAQKAGDQVQKTGKPFKFDPMTAKERRIIHISLKNYPGVETLSEGEGMFRKVVVKPADKTKP